MDRDDPRHQQRIGLIYGLAAYAWWGFIPLYFRLVADVAPLIVLAHRVVWSAVFLVAIVFLQRRWSQVAAVMREPRTLVLLSVGAVLIGINWYVFIYATATQQVMQLSLGYYITPLICVVLGMVMFGERMRAMQWSALVLAMVGVLVMASEAGTGFPWIALTVAFAFGLYTLTRKFIAISPMIALCIETVILVPIAAVVLVMRVDAAVVPRQVGLLMLAGVVTVLPLLWFAIAARRLQLSTMGFLQYLPPSLQFLCAVAILGEPLAPRRLASFVLIWVALAVFTLDALLAHRAPAIQAAAVPPPE